ncbi:BZ3500_MvSof-1268-A1-R1_Chr5-2g08090 [Microbotryum saponariae]|uniref:BZ3500_MvSof-1268-A1-R1_Chr5-2g08090 protein n=1 Tax=Microbotryum saponariae TaxID=289078 RepID=A0A2X0KGG8_9BASI|nr:BZ3500_MvSof-1268-A1-R1_Chr5-2g08090 [Microbotryum saponariae]SDA05959.1 BZ3501_MvSof-1269-A2-R1_Chr5-2g07912 [Microbotryum saponariae]
MSESNGGGRVVVEGGRVVVEGGRALSGGKQQAVDVYDDSAIPLDTSLGSPASASSASRESLVPITKSHLLRVGALGIPLSDDEDFADDDAELDSRPSTRSDLGSVLVNPASPGLPPRVTPDHGHEGTMRLQEVNHLTSGSVYSGKGAMSAIGKEQERFSHAGANSALSEGSFRDIVREQTTNGVDQNPSLQLTLFLLRIQVDDLTIENRKLKGRLRRFEASSVPASMEQDRLFEVRFFDGFPPSRRQELESFLTHYVQQIQSEDGEEIQGGPPPLTSVAKPCRDPRADQESATLGTDTTSSIGVTLRSLRSSEKEELSKRLNVGWPEEGSGSGSGSGSADRLSRKSGRPPLSTENVERVKSESDIAVPPSLPANVREGSHERAMVVNSSGLAPLQGEPSAEAQDVVHPYDGEQSWLAAPSFSGIEPQSASGTGTGMRISNPQRREARNRPAAKIPFPSISRRQSHSAIAAANAAEEVKGESSAEESEESPPPHNVGTAGSDDSGSDEMTTSLTTAEPLAKIVVELVERLFAGAWLSSPMDDPSLNPLLSEPSPLPPTSSSNTRYLRTMLDSEETKRGGGWVYLNLILTMAGVHRLNLSIDFLRWSLKRRSHRIEVSKDGSKVRWRGEARKRNEVESAIASAEGVDANDATMDDGAVEAVEQRRQTNNLVVSTSLRAPATDSNIYLPREADTASSDSCLRRVAAPEDDMQSGSVPTTLSSIKDSNTTSKNSNSTGATSIPTGGSGSGRSKNDSNSLRDESGRSTRSGVSRASISGTATNSLTNSQPSDALRKALQKELLDARGVPDYTLHDGTIFVVPLGGDDDSTGTDTEGITRRNPSVAPYRPMFAKRQFEDDESDYFARSDDGSSSGHGEDSMLHSTEGGAHSTEARGRAPARKRSRRHGASDGGLVFFRSDVFCSDLAGNAHVRDRLERSPSADSDAVDRARISRSDGEDDAGDNSPNASLFVSTPSSPTHESETSGQVVELSDTTSKALVWPSWETETFSQMDVESETSGLPSLSLSGMTNVVPMDHFTIRIKSELVCDPSVTPPPNLRQRHARAVIASLASLLPSRPTSSAPPKPLHTTRILEERIVTHLPSSQVRFPRLRMRRQGSDSDDDSSGEEVFWRRALVEPPADYLLSLGIPFHGWAPETRRDGGSEAVASSFDPDNEPISLD